MVVSKQTNKIILTIETELRQKSIYGLSKRLKVKRRERDPKNSTFCKLLALKWCCRGKVSSQAHLEKEGQVQQQWSYAMLQMWIGISPSAFAFMGCSIDALATTPKREFSWQQMPQLQLHQLPSFLKETSFKVWSPNSF